MKGTASGYKPPTRRALEWQASGACVGTDPEVFYPPKGSSTRAAVRICRTCPVIAECLAFAIANNDEWGVWGGMGGEDRTRMRRRIMREKSRSRVVILPVSSVTVAVVSVPEQVNAPWLLHSGSSNQGA